MKLELTINELKELMNTSAYDVTIEDVAKEKTNNSNEELWYIAVYAELLNNGDINTAVTPPYQNKWDAIEDILDKTWDDCITPRKVIEAELIQWDISHPQYIDISEDNKKYHMCYEIHSIKI